MENIVAKFTVDSTDWDRVAAKMGIVTAQENKLQKEIAETTAAIKGETTAYVKAGDAAATAGKKAQEGAATAKRGFADLGGTVNNLQSKIVAAFSVAAVVQFGSKVVDATAKNEAMTASLNTMLKSKEQANILMGQLAKFAATTPFELVEIQEATKKLLAFGVRAGEIETTLRSLGDVSAGIGAPIQEIAEIYGKARVQGRLFAEDVNQLTGRGIPIIQELAKQFGVTEGEVKKLVETGKVGFGNLEKAMKDLTGEGGQFFGLMDAQSKTLGGRISNLTDSFGRLFVNLGKANSGVLNKTVELMGNLVNKIATNLQSVEDVASEKAAGPITKFSDNLRKEFEATANMAERTGQSTSAALKAQADELAKGIADKLFIAQNELKKAEVIIKGTAADYDGVGFADPKEHARVKEELANRTANVKLYQAQLEALTRVQKEVITDQNKLNAEMAAAAKPTDAEIKKLQQLREVYQKLVKDLDLSARESALNLKDAILGEGDPAILQARAKLAKDSLIREFAEARAEIKKAGAEAGVSSAQVNVKIKLLDNDLQNQLKTINAQTARGLEEIEETRRKTRVAGSIKTAQETEQIEKAFLQNRYNLELNDLNGLLANKLITVEQYEKDKKDLEDQYRRESIQAEIKYLQNRVNLPGLDPAAKLDAEAKIIDKQKELYELDGENFKAVEKQKTDDAKKEAEEREKIIEAGVETFTSIANAAFDISANRRAAEIEQEGLLRDAEIILAGDNAKKKAVIEAEHANKIKALRTQQAKADKEQALFNIGIQTAMGIMRAISDVPKVDFGISTAILVGLYAAQGLAQAAVVAAKPLPKFRDGTAFVEGPGTTTSDSIHAMLSRGERVTRASTNRKYFDTLNAIDKELVSPEILNMAVGNIVKFGDFRGPKIENNRYILKQNNEEVVAAINSLPGKLPLHVSRFDESGYSSYTQQGLNRKTILNRRFAH